MATPANPRSVHILIEGLVQGVGYRAWLDMTARGRGLTGWVRNRRDGAVEAVVSGPHADVEAMIASCRIGPPAARVDRLQQLAEGMESFPDFQVRPTV